MQIGVNSQAPATISNMFYDMSTNFIKTFYNVPAAIGNMIYGETLHVTKPVVLQPARLSRQGDQAGYGSEHSSVTKKQNDMENIAAAVAVLGAYAPYVTPYIAPAAGAAAGWAGSKIMKSIKRREEEKK